MSSQTLVDWAPLLELLLLTLCTVALPVLWVRLRYRASGMKARLAAVTAFTMFLTFDLIAFGAYTRLSDSGLGCPDWPGCYAESSPTAAREHILEAEAAMPSGPVTWTKAWIEMIHRYLAMLLGGLILLLAIGAVWANPYVPQAWVWPGLTLIWVLVQGAFGAFTVTLKLYPAVVSAHLLGAMVLLGLLVCQHEGYRQARVNLSPGLRGNVIGLLVLLSAQIGLGAWVSTNYAVLACQGFPTCNGSWWPEAEFAQGFTLLRHLGQDGAGGYLGAASLVGIHLVHRAMAFLVACAACTLIWRLWRCEGKARRYAQALAGILLLQLASGIGNVLLQWPLPIALLHTSGAAAWVAVLVSLLARSRRAAAQVEQGSRQVSPPTALASP
jgi:cytochrome c oxidase assembly protein subunit 15